MPARRSRYRPILGVVFAALILAGTVAGVWYWRFQTYHFAAVDTGVLYRDGNRSLREFVHAVEKAHVKTVVSLIDDRELTDPAKPQFQQEAAWCAAHGVKQIRLPVKLGGWPSTRDVRAFLKLTQDPANQPVLVHCAQGVRRTGMLVAAYQLSVEHLSPDQARAAVLRFGHSDRDVADVATFIDLFQPATRELPTTMPAGSAE